MNSRQARGIASLYRNISLIDRLHIYIRIRRSYFDIIEKYIPKSGNILDFGCGHGFFSLYLEKKSIERQITGTDISDKKIRIANLSIHNKKNIFVVDKNLDILNNKNYFDCITVLNVLYLLKSEEQQYIMKKLISSLKKKGVLIILEPDADLKFLTFITKIREYMMVKLFRLTSGENVLFRSKNWWIKLLKKHFKVVKSVALSKNNFHQLYICEDKIIN